MNRFSQSLILVVVLLCSSCTWGPRHDHYRCCYAYLEEPVPAGPMTESDYFLVLLTEARRLDYSDTQYFMRTCAKHPSDGSKNGDVGHAWIMLHGWYEGQKIVIEGGHSGELGEVQAKYFEGVLNNVAYGSPDPSPEQKKNPTFEPDPIKYLWEPQLDGYFQMGSGGHRPTFAAKVDLTKEQFEHLLDFIDPENYDFSEYSITGRQCSTFLGAVADEVGLHLEHQVVLHIDDTMEVGGEDLQMWADPYYSSMTISSPDIIEKSLMEAVRNGEAENATDWYEENYPQPTGERIGDVWENFYKFPERVFRMFMFW